MSVTNWVGRYYTFLFLKSVTTALLFFDVAKRSESTEIAYELTFGRSPVYKYFLVL